MQKKLLILLTLKISLISSCAHEDIPKTDIKVYRGSSEDFALVRKQDNDIKSCFEKSFDDYYCMNSKDFKSFLEKKNKCE